VCDPPIDYEELDKELLESRALEVLRDIPGVVVTPSVGVALRAIDVFEGVAKPRSNYNPWFAHVVINNTTFYVPRAR